MKADIVGNPRPCYKNLDHREKENIVADKPASIFWKNMFKAFIIQIASMSADLHYQMALEEDHDNIIKLYNNSK